MTIYPKDVQVEKLRHKWDIAAVDVPVPAQLTDFEDQRQWQSYLSCLSPAQQMRKLGQALDQFQGLIAKTTDPMALSKDEQVTLYSKWEASELAALAVIDRLQFMMPDPDGTRFKSDIDMALFYLCDFLKSVNSPDVQKWEERRKLHNEIDVDKFDKFIGHYFSEFKPSEPTVTVVKQKSPNP